jgi:hypothetical protein
MASQHCGKGCVEFRDSVAQSICSEAGTHRARGWLLGGSTAVCLGIPGGAPEGTDTFNQRVLVFGRLHCRIGRKMMRPGKLVKDSKVLIYHKYRFKTAQLRSYEDKVDSIMLH